MSTARDLSAFLVRRAYMLALLNVLLIGLVAYGASQLVVHSGIRVLFSPDDPNLLAEIHIEDTYGKEDNILIVVDGGDRTLFNADGLSLLETLTTESWQIPHSRRVDSITNFLHTEVDGDDLMIDPLVPDASLLESAGIERVRKIALAELTLLGRLVSEDGNAAAVNISLNLKEEGKAAALAEAVNATRALLADVALEYPDVELHLAGLALTEQTLAEVTAADGASLIPLLFVVVLVAAALFLRSAWAALCTFVTVILSIVVGMGFAGWVGFGINSVSVSAPAIIVTLAVADCIHLLSAFLARLREGKEKRAALEESLRHKLYPIVLTSLTTAVGFLSMNFSESPPFGELGTISAAGVIGALWVTLGVLPALLLLLPFRTGGGAVSTWKMTGLADFVTGQSTLVLAVGAVLVVGLVSCISRMELNDDPAGYFSEDIALTKALSVVEDKLAGTQHVYFSLDSGAAEGVSDPAYLERVANFVAWLRAQPEVTNVDSFTDTLKRLNQVMHGDDPAWYRLPDSRELAAQYLLLYEISVPYGQDVTYQVSADKAALKVSVVLRNQKSRVVDFEQRARDWLAANAPNQATRGAGHAVSFASIGLNNIYSMLYGSAFAIALVSLCLLVAFRSVRFGIVSVVPNLFPALLALGAWSALVQEVNMAASTVFAATLGIVVDDTTHMLVAYRNARVTRGMEAAAAIRSTYESVGHALVTTTLALAAGFAVLTQSDFSVNATSGSLMAMTILIALAIDLLLLPALLVRIDRWLIPTRGV